MSMHEELKDLIKSLNNNDRRLDGEDGGDAISTLAEHLMPVGIINAGRVDYGFDGYCNLLIKVYDYHGWKFVVQEDQDVHPVYDGGTVYTGTVDLYNITSKAV
jgi:hypothetical protein